MVQLDYVGIGKRIGKKAIKNKNSRTEICPVLPQLKKGKKQDRQPQPQENKKP